MLLNDLYPIGLVLHIIGLTCFAGGAVGSLFIETNLWKQLQDAPYRAVALVPSLRSLPNIISAGSLLLLISGVMMLQSVSWTSSAEIWFIIKMALYLLLNLNVFFVGKPAFRKLEQLIPGLFETDPGINSELASIRSKMRWYHITELSMLVFVYILSVYKFQL